MHVSADGRQANARAFIEKFGFGEIDIDNFDMFIIDNKLADDPKTDDTKSNDYKAFVHARAAAKRQLNAGAAHLDENSFIIEVIDAGKTYNVASWAGGAMTAASNMGFKVKRFADGRFQELKKLHTDAEKLYSLASGDHRDELQEVTMMISFMRQQGLELNAKVKGLVAQYDSAANGVEDHVKALIAKSGQGNPELEQLQD